MAEHDRRNGTRRIRADTRHFALKVFNVIREHPLELWVLYDRLCRLVNTRGTTVVPEPTPSSQYIVRCRFGECLNGWPALHPCLPIVSHGFDACLLKHNFRDPDLVRASFEFFMKVHRWLLIVCTCPLCASLVYIDPLAPPWHVPAVLLLLEPVQKTVKPLGVIEKLWPVVLRMMLAQREPRRCLSSLGLRRRL